MIKIRHYQPGDEWALREIFFNTIRNVNCRDYSQSQVEAWAPGDYDRAAWSERIRAIHPFVAVLEGEGEGEGEGEIVGYADVQADGYIDHFFCHCAHQGKGIGKMLMEALFEAGLQKDRVRLYSQVSITAKPFFAHFGFTVVKPQRVTIRGQVLTNFVMEKIL